MPNPATAIGIFGGTFDPIHNAHLRVALDLLEALPLDQIRFVPAKSPPHRGAPAAAPEQRVAMLRLALGDENRFVLDQREIHRQGPSYTFDTLASLRQEMPSTPLCLILGTDAFQSFSSWYRWSEIGQLAHLVIASRPGYGNELAEAVRTMVAASRLHDCAGLTEETCGRVYFQTVTQLHISASAVRGRVAAGGSPRYLVAESVNDYIRANGLYRPAASCEQLNQDLHRGLCKQTN